MCGVCVSVSFIAYENVQFAARQPFFSRIFQTAREQVKQQQLQNIFTKNDRMNEQKYTRSYSVCRAENNNPKPKATEKEEEEKKESLI